MATRSEPITAETFRSVKAGDRVLVSEVRADPNATQSWVTTGTVTEAHSADGDDFYATWFAIRSYNVDHEVFLAEVESGDAQVYRFHEE